MKINLKIIAEERKKVAIYARTVQACHLEFVPFPMSTYGDLSPQASRFLNEAAEFYAGHVNEQKSACHQNLLQQLQVALMVVVGKRLVAAVNATEDTGSPPSGASESAS